jgi:hypothetical protein
MSHCRSESLSGTCSADSRSRLGTAWMPGLVALLSADCRLIACRRRGQTVKNRPAPAPRGRRTTLPDDYCDLPQQGDQWRRERRSTTTTRVFSETDWLDVPPDQYDDTMATNVRLPFFASQGVARPRTITVRLGTRPSLSHGMQLSCRARRHTRLR